MSVFETMNSLNINGHTEKKKAGNIELTYLSWPWAWAETKKRYENASYTVWKDDKGRPYTSDPETGYMVYTTVTIDGITHEMWLPVMDGANNAMKAVPYDYTVRNPNFKWAKWDTEKGGYYDKYGNEQPEMLTKHVQAATMFDINKTIMRCLVKNLAMFGLGLYIYAGEDLPEGETESKEDSVESIPVPEQKVSPKATVKTAETLPPATMPEKPKQQMTEAQILLAQSIANMSKDIPKFDFRKMRKKLIDEQIIEDIPSDQMTIEEAAYLIDQMYKRFRK